MPAPRPGWLPRGLRGNQHQAIATGRAGCLASSPAAPCVHSLAAIAGPILKNLKKKKTIPRGGGGGAGAAADCPPVAERTA